jgi:hypothetical protein
MQVEVPVTKAGKLRSLAWATYPDVAAAKRAVKEPSVLLRLPNMLAFLSSPIFFLLNAKNSAVT